MRWQQEGERVNVERVTEVPHFAKFELWLCLVRAQLGYATPRHVLPRLELRLLLLHRYSAQLVLLSIWSQENTFVCDMRKLNVHVLQ